MLQPKSIFALSGSCSSALQPLLEIPNGFYKKMDATSCVVSIPRTAEWDAIIAFANHPRATFDDVRKNRPPQATITKALSDYLENIKLRNCKTNAGFLNALGLTALQSANPIPPSTPSSINQ